MERAIHRSLLGRSPSTVCRELVRNSTPRDGYALQSAQAACQARRDAARPAPKLHPHSRLWHTVCDLLLWRWSPQQIARTLQRIHPDDPRQSVSHETIYNAVRPPQADDRLMPGHWEGDLIKGANNRSAVGVLV